MCPTSEICNPQKKKKMHTQANPSLWDSVTWRLQCEGHMLIIGTHSCFWGSCLCGYHSVNSDLTGPRAGPFGSCRAVAWMHPQKAKVECVKALFYAIVLPQDGRPFKCWGPVEGLPVTVRCILEDIGTPGSSSLLLPGRHEESSFAVSHIPASKQ